ncbi:MAG: hypothetical protein QM286_05895 [Acidobacteriota bacterium]|nr:hypothetical protein [Acidobacteriota bacterium]
MVVETFASGHRLLYVREIISEALARRVPIVFGTTDEVLRDPNYRQHLAELGDSFQVVVLNDQITVRSLQRRAREEKCDLVVVPDALKFGVAFFLGAASSAPLVRMLVMNDPRWRSSIGEYFASLAFLKLAVLYASNLRRSTELLWLRPQGTTPEPRYVIDPVLLERDVQQLHAESLRFRSALRMDPEIFWFGVVGSLTSRKNIPLIVDALRQVATVSDNPIGLALLGPWADDSSRRATDNALIEAPFICLRRDELLTNLEMNVAVAALDCVVMAYSTHAPNSTTAKAAALGVRVATAGSPTFRAFASRLTGQRGVELEVNSLASELRDCMIRPRPSPLSLIGPEGLTEPLLAPIPWGMRR